MTPARAGHSLNVSSRATSMPCSRRLGPQATAQVAAERRETPWELSYRDGHRRPGWWAWRTRVFHCLGVRRFLVNPFQLRLVLSAHSSLEPKGCSVLLIGLSATPVDASEPGDIAADGGTMDAELSGNLGLVAVPKADLAEQPQNLCDAPLCEELPAAVVARAATGAARQSFGSQLCCRCHRPPPPTVLPLHA